MEKPSKINEDTYKEFVVAMKKIIDVPGYAPSRNYLKREISSPTRYVVCSECKAGGVTLYKRDKSTGDMYCKRHKDAPKND